MTNEQDIKKILQLTQVNAGNDALFSRRKKLDIAKDHLTLIVGSGGSGVEAVSKALRIAKQKLERDYVKYMKVILVDSDDDTINPIAEEFPDIQIINTSLDGVKGRLEPRDRDTFYKNFIPSLFPYATIDSHGAGQKRLVGRVKFYDGTSAGTTRYIDAIFRDTIKKLYTSGDWASLKDRCPVDIMILAGLYGGNGSGTFLDLAANARYACENVGGIVDSVYGYLFLPVEGCTASSYANAYAALKELENLMSVQYTIPTYFQSQERGANISTKYIFDAPFLIEGNKEENKSMMAECILNLVVKNNGLENGDDDIKLFSQKSFYSNTDQGRIDYLTTANRKIQGLLKRNFYPEDSMRYAGIGYAYADIPTETAVANIVSHVVKSLYDFNKKGKDGKAIGFCTTERRDILSVSDMENQIQTLFQLDDSKVDKFSLWRQKIDLELNRAAGKCTPGKMADISKRDILSGNVESYKDTFQKDTCVKEGVKEIENYFNLLFENFKKASKTVFCLYGPGVMKLLYEGIGPIDEYGNQTKAQSIKELLEQVELELGNLSTSSNSEDVAFEKGNIFRALAGTDIAEWKRQFKTMMQDQTKKEIVKKIKEPAGAWQRFRTDLIQYIESCQVFATRLELLKDVYENYGRPLDFEDFGEFKRSTKSENFVNLCTDARVYDWIRGKIDNKIISIDIEMMRDDLISSFLQYPERWTSMRKGETRKEFDRVVSKRCQLGQGADEGTGLQLTVMDYFQHVLEGVDDGNLARVVNTTVQLIVGELLTKSAPTLSKKPDTHSLTNRFVMIPDSIDSSPFKDVIKSAFKDALRNGLSEREEVQLITSPSVTEIVCYQTSVSNALNDLTNLAQWEAYYNDANADAACFHSIQPEHGFNEKYDERTKSEIENMNRIHTGQDKLLLTPLEDVIFGTGLSMEHYPPVNLSGVNNNEKEQTFLRNIFNPVVEYALQQKIIECKKENGTEYSYVINLLPDRWKNLDVSGYCEWDNETGGLKRGEELFEYLAMQNRIAGVTEERKKRILLENTIGPFASAYNFGEALRNMQQEDVEAYSISYMKRILRKDVNLFRELRKTLCVYYAVAKQLESMEKEHLIEQNWEDFQKYYGYDIIGVQENKWYFKTQTDDGIKQKYFCQFLPSETNKYSGLEKNLYNANLKFLVAFKKFIDLNKRELERCLERKLLEYNDREAVLRREQQIKMMQLAELKNDLANVFVPSYVRHREDINTEQLLSYIKEKYPLRSATQIDEWYMDAICVIWNNVQFTNIEPIVEVEAWNCQSCGTKNIPGRHSECPICGATKPRQELSKWNCIECGTSNIPEKYAECPICGALKPEEKELSNTIWNCMECGTRNIPGKYIKCPICDAVRQNSSELSELPWVCLECGTKNIPGKYTKCPICDAKRV